MSKLANKVAVITGGNSGIGLETARLFQSEGARVIITGRNREKVQQAASELGSNVSGVVADLSQVSEVERMAQRIGELTNQVDILFLNAGVAFYAPIEQIDEAFYDQQFDTNVKGLFFSIKYLLPLFKDKGSIILNSSINSFMAFPTSNVYAATKAAVNSLGRTLSGELIQRGIRINTISPGPIQTPIYGKMGMKSEQMQEMAGNIQGMIPMDRFGQSEEIAKAALYFASDDSAFTVGAELAIDGVMGTLR